MPLVIPLLVADKFTCVLLWLLSVIFSFSRVLLCLCFSFSLSSAVWSGKLGSLLQHGCFLECCICLYPVLLTPLSKMVATPRQCSGTERYGVQSVLAILRKILMRSAQISVVRCVALIITVIILNLGIEFSCVWISWLSSTRRRGRLISLYPPPSLPFLSCHQIPISVSELPPKGIRKTFYFTR